MLYIRADMNRVVATGHLMRCLSVADAARNSGENTTFLLADSQACSLLDTRGYPYIILNTLWDNLDSELPVIKKVISERNIKTLLIDTYQVTEKYLSDLTAMVNTVYIDDINKFIYPVNAVICYANYYKKFNYEINYPFARLYLGSSYAPLRAEFANCPKKAISNNADNLLLLSGGSDNFHIIERLLSVIPKDSYSRIDAVCGAYNRDYEELCVKYQSYSNIHLHKNISNMKKYMERADIAVSAGGSTLYELCAIGTPTISYSFADNQSGNVTQFQEDGLIDYAGDFRTDDVPKAVNLLLKKYRDEKLRLDKSRKMQRLIDGKGAMRIAKALIKENEK